MILSTLQSAYNLTNLQPTAMYKFWKNMNESTSLLKLFHKHLVKSRQDMHYSADRQILCDILYTAQINNPKCLVSKSKESLRNLADYYNSDKLMKLADHL